MIPSFTRLNIGWNADPNAPDDCAFIDGRDVLLQFDVNGFQFPEFDVGERGVLRFREFQPI